MNQKQMRDFLKEVYETHKSGGDVRAVIAEYENKYKYVYVYNDACAKHILTIVEVKKFLEHSRTDFVKDRSRLAQWLRAIDALNNNGVYSEFSVDENFLRLQKWAKLSNFMPEVFIQAGESMDKRTEEEVYIARQEERQKSAAVIAEKDAEISSKDAEISSQAAENARLKAEIEALRAQLAK